MGAPNFHESQYHPSLNLFACKVFTVMHFISIISEREKCLKPTENLTLKCWFIATVV